MPALSVFTSGPEAQPGSLAFKPARSQIGTSVLKTCGGAARASFVSGFVPRGIQAKGS
jgi:hypothetical protein